LWIPDSLVLRCGVQSAQREERISSDSGWVKVEGKLSRGCLWVVEGMLMTVGGLSDSSKLFGDEQRTLLKRKCRNTRADNLFASGIGLSINEMRTYNRTPTTMTFAPVAVTTVHIAPASPQSLPIFFRATLELLIDQFRYVLQRVIFALGGNGWAVGRHHKCTELLKVIQDANQVKVAIVMGKMERLEAQE
jgi:hypothetical protein